MYSDIPKWLNIFQSYVQLTRLELQTSKPSSNNIRVQMFERSIQNNRYCFLEHAYRNGTLHEADYSVLDHWFRWIRSSVDIDLDLIGTVRKKNLIINESFNRFSIFVFSNCSLFAQFTGSCFETC